MDQPVRNRNTTSNASPMGSTVAVIIAIAAVLAGFFILRSIRDDEPSTGDSSNGNTTEPDNSTASIPVVTDPPVVVTDPPLVVSGASVVVSNFSGTNGAAGVLTDLLEAEGFTMATAVSRAANEGKIDTTIVLYDANTPAAKAVAESVARLLGGVQTGTVGLPLPTETGTWPDTATKVLVKLGNDLAGDDALPGADGGTPSTDETPSQPTDPAPPTPTT